MSADTQGAALTLQECEARIESSLSAFAVTGEALREIRDSRLYRGSYLTFEAYCVARWEFTRSYAYRLISAARVVENVAPGATFIPKAEKIVRPLTRLETPEQQRAAWTLAVSRSSEPTAEIVAQAVFEIDGRFDPRFKESRPDPILGELRRLWMQASEEVRETFSTWIETIEVAA